MTRQGALCIIPARGGSKRIPRKNLRDFCGRPIINWSIAAAQDSGCFERIIVSTDDPEIAQVAIDAGAEVPFIRPSTLADDHTPTQPVIAHAIGAAALPQDATTPVCCLYATAPFVQPGDLCRAMAHLVDTQARFVVAVTRFAYPIQRALRRAADGSLSMFHPEHASTRSQDLEEGWHDAGQFYVAPAANWFSPVPILGEGSTGIELPRSRVQDIDTEEDWQMAQLLFRAQGLGE